MIKDKSMVSLSEEKKDLNTSKVSNNLNQSKGGEANSSILKDSSLLADKENPQNISVQNQSRVEEHQLSQQVEEPNEADQKEEAEKIQNEENKEELA